MVLLSILIRTFVFIGSSGTLNFRHLFAAIKHRTAAQVSVIVGTHFRELAPARLGGIITPWMKGTATRFIGGIRHSARYAVKYASPFGGAGE